MATKSHVVLVGSKRKKDPTATKIGKIDPKEIIDATVSLAGPKLPSADEYVGKTLTAKEFKEQYASSKEDADKVAKSLKKFGLKIDSVSLVGRSMRVSGTVAAMEKAFKAGMVLMHSPLQGDYRGREGTLQIPAELKGLITGVFGLDERQMAKRKSSAAHASQALAALTPADLEKRYNFPAGDAAGQSIAIAEFGGGYFDDDLRAYCEKFQRDVPDVQAISVGAPAFTFDEIAALPPVRRRQELLNSIEVMMDIQVIAGLCPKAAISVYFSTFDQQGWIDLLNRAITDKPVVLSVSWGLAEDDPSWSPNAIDQINDRLNALRLLGITTCVSSGDDGSGDQINDHSTHVDFPGSSPHVLGVGGTMLKKSGASIKEITWWESPGRRTQNGGGATGGGVSTGFDRPAWQTVTVASLNPNSIDGRVVPDVAALAGAPLYDLIFRGDSQPNGGTSASAPLWAALIARVNALLPPAKQQRFLTPLLYQNGSDGKPIGQSACVDILSGNNVSRPFPGVGYSAKQGFDAVTGWGVPDGKKLAAALSQV